MAVECWVLMRSRPGAVRESFAGKAQIPEALETLVGRPLVSSDGLMPNQIEAAERKLKSKLPTALKEYYELAGRPALNVEHNRLYSPKELIVEDGWLIFMEENQAVVFWGVKAAELRMEDPKVYRRATSRNVGGIRRGGISRTLF